MLEIDEQEDLFEEDAADLVASDLVETTIKFVGLDGDEVSFAAGAEVTCLIGFNNLGEDAFTAGEVEASFRHPEAYYYSIVNFTKQAYEVTVPAGEQAAFQYKFTPHGDFEPAAVGVVINIIYTDHEGSHFRDAVFNGTLMVTENTTPLDLMELGTAALALVAAIIFVMEWKGKAVVTPFVNLENKPRAARAVATTGGGGGGGGGASYEEGILTPTRVAMHKANSSRKGKGKAAAAQ